jgi:hypothetical protein
VEVAKEQGTVFNERRKAKMLVLWGAVGLAGATLVFFALLPWGWFEALLGASVAGSLLVLIAASVWARTHPPRRQKQDRLAPPPRNNGGGSGLNYIAALDCQAPLSVCSF